MSAMKKLAVVSLLALAGFLVLVTLVGSSVFYVSVYRPLASARTSIVIGEALEQQIERKTAFVPPADGRLSQDQVARFLRVGEQIEASLGSRAGVLRSTCETFERLDAKSGLTLGDVLQALGEVAGPFRDAKQIQVRALNEARFAKSEYEWVRRRVYEAAGVDLRLVDLRGIRSGLDAGARVSLLGSPGADVDPETRSLVEPFASRLQAWRTIAFFDL
jgi:hypothetical protein